MKALSAHSSSNTFREAACRGSGDGCANLAHTLLSCNLVDEARDMAMRGVELGRWASSRYHFVGLCVWHHACLSVTAVVVAARVLLHPDHVTQQSCATAVSLLFSALDRPTEQEMSVQVH